MLTPPAYQRGRLATGLTWLTQWEFSSWNRLRTYMLSALIPSAGRKAAVPLAGQLPHESCVRPGPLVLGTAFLRFPTAAMDRDRTVSRVFSRITAGTDYTFTLFQGAGVSRLP